MMRRLSGLSSAGFCTREGYRCSVSCTGPAISSGKIVEAALHAEAAFTAAAVAAPLSYFTSELWAKYAIWKNAETILRKDRAHFPWEQEVVP
jgi:hypothetical protein